MHKSADQEIIDSISNLHQKKGSFKTNYRKLAKLYGADAGIDLKLDSSKETFTRTAIASIIRLLPLAERKYLKERTESSAYAFNALINQVRELQSDLQSMHSMDGQAEYIADEILANAQRNVLQTLINELLMVRQHTSLAKFPKAAKQINKQIDQLTTSVAKYLDENQKAVRAQIYSYLVGDAVTPVKKKKKKTTRTE